MKHARLFPPLKEWERRLRHKFIGDNLGEHLTRRRGRGLDFHSVRPYQSGDDWRRLDPKVSARRGELITREFAEEQEQTIWMMIDSSPTMHWGSTEQTKWEAAVEVAALFTMALLRQSDRVGIWQASPGRSHGVAVAPQKGPRGIRRLLDAWQTPERDARPLEESLTLFLRQQRRRSVPLVFLDETGSIPTSLLGAIARRHHLVVVPVSDPLERSMPDRGLVRWRDIGTGAGMVVDTSDVQNRLRYEEAAEARRSRWRKEVRRLGAEWWDWQALEPMAT